MLKLFSVRDHSPWQLHEPVYVLRDGRFYRTVYHPAGWSEKPDYELRSDGRIYRTPYHKLGGSEVADYVIGEDRGLYRADGHPDRDEKPLPADFVLADE